MSFFLRWELPSIHNSRLWRSLGRTCEEFHELRDEKPRREGECKAQKRSLHPCLRLIDSGTISRNTARKLHLEGMIDQGNDRDRSSESKEDLYNSSDNFRDIIHREVTTAYCFRIFSCSYIDSIRIVSEGIERAHTEGEHWYEQGEEKEWNTNKKRLHRRKYMYLSSSIS